MTGLAAALLGAAAVVAVVDWVAVQREDRRVEYVCKPLVMVVLVGAALAVDGPSAGERAWFVAALVASLAGDVFLMLPERPSGLAAEQAARVGIRRPGRPAGEASGGTDHRTRRAGFLIRALSEDRFIPGLVSFLLAHLAYVAGLVARGVDGAWLVAGVALVAAGLVAVGRPLMRGVGRSAPAMRIPVLAYMVVISSMVVAAIGTGDGLAMAGAVLFYTSDGLIGLTRFVRPHPLGRLAVMVTYHLGQGLLVLSLA